MNELVIKKNRFEKAKNELKKFSTTKPKELTLKKVDVDGGLFNWFDHKVTGYELNELTGQIQEYLIKFNKVNTQLIKEFGQVYNALDALDEDYIQAILISIKAAEKASAEAKEAQKDINNTIEVLEQTISILEKFKQKIDQYEYLDHVDEVWINTQKFAKELTSIQTNLTNLHAVATTQEEQIDTLNELKDEVNSYHHLQDIDQLWADAKELAHNFHEVDDDINKMSHAIQNQAQQIITLNELKDELDRYEHLKDVDQLWHDARNFEKQFQKVDDEHSKMSHAIQEQSQQINALNEFKDELDRYEHLKDVDQLWHDARNFEKQFQKVDEEHSRMSHSIQEQSQQINTLNKFKDELDSYEHLRDVDQLWADSKSAQRDMTELQQKVIKLDEHLNETKRQMAEDKTNHELEVVTLNKKTKIAYAIAGTSLGVSILHFSLNILGIL